MNKMEELRVQQIARSGCIACAFLEIVNVHAIEIHHILEGGRRMGDWFTIPLCRGHHQGDWTPEQRVMLGQRSVRERRVYLTAISDGRKAFTRVYPTERMLWEMVQDMLGLTWPIAKIVPRIVA